MTNTGQGYKEVFIEYHPFTKGLSWSSRRVNSVLFLLLLLKLPSLTDLDFFFFPSPMFVVLVRSPWLSLDGLLSDIVWVLPVSAQSVRVEGRGVRVTGGFRSLNWLFLSFMIIS